MSGYLASTDEGQVGSGGIHAWAEVCLPGAGWITFDPTNRSLGGANLVPVAVVPDIHQAMPVTVGLIGSSDAFLNLTVTSPLHR